MPTSSRSVTQVAPGRDEPPGPAENRWFGAGYSTSPDPGNAGAEAVAQALAGRDAALLLVSTSMDPQHLPALAEAVRSGVRPGTAVVGCTTFAEITPKGPTEGGVVVVAIGGDGFTVRTALSRDLAGRQRDAGTEVAKALGETGRPNQVLTLIPDGSVGRQHELVRGAYSVVGAGIPMAGGCSADSAYRQTHQLFGDHSGVEVLTGSVVAAIIGSDGPIGIGMAHGWRRSGEPMMLTSSDEIRIHEFDHQPALDVYLRRTGCDPSIVNDSAAMSAVTITNPLGLARRSGEDIRVIYSVDPDDRSINCFADVQQGVLAWLMESDSQALIEGGQRSCEQAVSALGGAAPIGILEFDCGVRRMMLGAEGCHEEIARMIDAAAGAPVAGYYSMGEIARIRGARGMHHMTSVSLAFG